MLNSTLSRLLPVLIAVSLTAPATLSADEKTDAAEEQAFKQAAALVSPSIVQIQTTGGRDQVGRILTGTGPTTGVVVSKDGYIISSAFNFISVPSTILVNLPDGRKNLLAKLVATDKSKMLTLLKIKADNLTPAPAAPKKSLKVGQWAIAMGRTFSADVPSVSVGIISALDRIWGKAIQTDAKVSPTNYGGPLVSIDGKVQGLLVPLSTRGQGETAGAEWYDSGIGFAVPMEDVYKAVERLKKGDDLHGGLIGIELRGAGVIGGDAVIDRVRANSPADQAGIKAGDKVLEIDGRKIIRSSNVRHALGPKYAGDTVEITLERDGKSLKKSVTLVEKLEPFEPAYLGILPARENAIEKKRPGVGIRHVFTGSPAEKAKLLKLDRIVKVNGKEIVDAAALADTISRLKPTSKVAIEYLRGKDRKTTTAELTTVPNTVAAELIPAAVLPGENVTAKTGRITVKMPKHEREYWAYIPDNYNPKHKYTLMVWLHPSNDTMEATIYKQWKRICDERGILVLGPKAGKLAGWVPNETEYIKDAIDDFKDKYSVDSSRVFLHSYSDGVQFAFQVLTKEQDSVSGAAVASGAPRSMPAGNSPRHRMQFYLVCGSDDPNLRFVQRTEQLLKRLKYPTVLTTIKDHGEDYPKPEQIKEIARWADSLDRI